MVVMVNVATNIQAPIKLLFPKGSWEGQEEGGAEPQYSLLGLGDIVVPGLNCSQTHWFHGQPSGIFLALLLRYDLSRRTTTTTTNSSAPSTPHFMGGMVGYILGMGVTLGVMFFFQHGQPALFYLVPGTIGGSFIASQIHGTFKEMIAYSEEEEVEKGEEEGEEEGKGDGEKDELLKKNE